MQTVDIPNVDPVQIVTKGLACRVGQKQILQDVDLVFQPGRLSVVVGSSGSGKTTLLSVLAGVYGLTTKKANVEGDILWNGTSIPSEKVRKLVGFVFQDDVILETMTTREAVEMSARLRIPPSRTEDNGVVDRMLNVSQLVDVQDVVIGAPAKTKGISGGERKRTSIAMELVSNPSVLILDEPTSGLDTYTAYRVMSLLEHLAHKQGRTVVMSLHQPSSEIYHMMDDLIILDKGKVVYTGLAEDIVPYFEKLGYEFEKYSNPADILFMKVLNVENTYKDGLRDHYLRSENFETLSSAVANPRTGGIFKAMFRYRAPFHVAFWYLLKRDAKNAWRNKMVLKTRTFQTLVLATFIALIFMNSADAPPPAVYQNFAGVLFFLVINAFFSSFNGTLPVFGVEKGSYAREYGQGYYGVTPYFLAKTVVELPLIVLFPVLTSLIVYWSVGLRPGLVPFLIFTTALTLVGLVGFSFGLFAAALFNDINVALAISILFILPVILFGGLFLNLAGVPVWLRWMQWISPMRYAYSAMMENQFVGYGESSAEAYYRQVGIDNVFSLEVNLLLTFCLFLVGLIASYVALARVTMH